MKHAKSRVDGAKLRRLREEMGLTIEDLAAETAKRGDPENKQGISSKTIWRMEHNGHAYPYTVDRVADALSVEPKDLLMDDKSVEGFLSEHPYDFGEFIEDRTRDFIGRQFVFDKIDGFVENNTCGYFFVRGDPGIGKSSVAAQLVKKRNYIHHFNIRAEGINRAETFLTNVCAQLIIDFNLPYQSLPSDAGVDGGFLSKLIVEVGQKLSTEGKVVILVDALDEVDESSVRPGANILYLPSRLPVGIFFVVTARRQSYQLRIECCQDKFDLEPKGEENRADVEAYLKDKVRLPGIQAYVRKHKLSRQDFVSTMKDRSEGNFMYLRYVLPEIEKGAYKELELSQIPMGLQNYYEDHWRRMGMMSRPLPQAKLKIVYILCEMVKPVSRELVADFSSEDEIAVQAVLDEWDEFLHRHEIDDERRFGIYHESFRDFLRRKDIVKATGVSLPEINKMIGDNLYYELYGDG